MPGMHSGLNVANTVLVTAFRAALLRQGLTALLVLVVLATIWTCLREWRPGLVSRPAAPLAGSGEAHARRLLRVSFGVLWIFDGILQAQPAMAAGLPGQVMAPAAQTSPGWVRHLVSWAGSAWSFHPVQAAAASVWIQAGIGIWMIAAARGRWSRLAGLSGVAWGLLVWIFGEAFGGIFAPGLTVLFGAPGAVLLYCVAGALVALPDRVWHSALAGRWLLSCLGVFLIGMAVLQAWPGRGFWQGRQRGQAGSLAGMVASMSGIPQPSPLARLVRDFGTLTTRHGFAVNLTAVVALAIIGLALLGRRPRVLTGAVAAAAAFCLADWVVVEDLGLFGGLGTDPNSMIPLLLLIAAGYVAVTRPSMTAAPAAVTAGAARGATAKASTGRASVPHGPVARPAGTPSWAGTLRPAHLTSRFTSITATGLLAAWAAALVLLGAAPMAVAQASSTADPIIALALNGPVAPVSRPAPPFLLTDQSGRQVSLASLRGRAVLLTFLDPAGTARSPLIAEELSAADRLLGRAAAHLAIVAIAASRLHHARPYLQAFDRRQHLNGLSNWHYLTGPLAELRRVWQEYGIAARAARGGQATARDDIMVVLDAAGRIRFEMNCDPGAGTAASTSSFAVEFSQAVRRALAEPPAQLSEGR